MIDRWCKKVRAQTGTVVSGGAARNVRIANAGGMEKILHDVAVDAATSALIRAENLSRRPRLQLVKKAA